MNKKLLTSTGNVQDYLEAIPDTLHSIIRGQYLDNITVTAMKYSPCGNYLALGMHNGEIRIYDVDSREWVRVLIGGHDAKETQVRLVADVAWMADSSNENTKNYIMASASNYQSDVFVWDIETKKQITKLNFEKVTTGIRFIDAHPINPYMFIVVPLDATPYLVVDYRTGEYIPLTLPSQYSSDGKGKQAYTIARFDPSGENIYIANGKKNIIIICKIVKIKDSEDVVNPISVIDIKTNETTEQNSDRMQDETPHSYKIEFQKNTIPLQSNAPVIDIQFSSQGNHLAVNTEFAICLYYKQSTKPYELEHEITNLVDKYRLSHPRFVHNYLLENVPDELFIYISNGSDICFVKLTTYETVKSIHRPQILEVANSPTRSLLAISSRLLDVQFYTSYFEQNWSCLEPNFSEIRTNVQYVEREDEFDLNTNTPTPTRVKYEPLPLKQGDIDIFSSNEPIKLPPKPLSIDDNVLQPPKY